MTDKEFLELYSYKKWEVKDPEDYNWDEVIYDGHGYVIMSNRERYDAPDDLYREERLRWNKLQNKDFIHLEIGRWTISKDGISTLKDNGQEYSFNSKEIWSYLDKGENKIYDLPVHLCSKDWISNVDLLDFNSAFLVGLELFEENKPSDFPKISWSETLRRQYKRFQNSLDINSFEGRKQYEYEKEYRKVLTYEEIYKLTKVDLDKESDNNNEVFGDLNSRMP